MLFETLKKSKKSKHIEYWPRKPNHIWAGSKKVQHFFCSNEKVEKYQKLVEKVETDQISVEKVEHKSSTSTREVQIEFWFDFSKKETSLKL